MPTFLRGKLLSYIVLIFAVFLAGYVIKDQKDIIVKILEIKIDQFLILSSVVFLTFFINGLRIKVLTSQFKVKLGNVESFALAIVNTFWNYLPLTGGLAARALYLKKRHNFSYTDFVSTVAASYIVSFLSYGLIGLGAILVLWKINGVFSFLIASPLLLVVIFSLIMMRIDLDFRFNNRIIETINKIFLGWKKLRGRERLVFYLILLDVVLVLVMGLRLFLAGQFLGTPVSFVSVLIISSLSLFAILLNITPGALVIREAIISFAAAALYYDAFTGLTIAILDRAVSMFWVLLLGVAFNFLILRPFYRKDVGD